jgi:hypothetical protein
VRFFLKDEVILHDNFILYDSYKIPAYHRGTAQVDNVALRPSYEPEPSPANASLCVKELCVQLFIHTLVVPIYAA